MAGHITAETVLKKPIEGGTGGFEDVTMGSLWADSPVLVLVMRRPGCSECSGMERYACCDEAGLGVPPALSCRATVNLTRAPPPFPSQSCAVNRLWRSGPSGSASRSLASGSS